MSQLRRNFYRAARTLGDVEAATKGPVPMAKRIARKQVYRRSNNLTRALLRAAGLSR